MKLCIFSDIHGNADALQAALDLIADEHADAHIFLGDLCGYYPNALECYEMIQSMPSLMALLGNHDQQLLDMASGRTDGKAYAKQYGQCLERLLGADAAPLRSWLGSLPDALTGDFWTAYHGSPKSPLEGYIYPDSALPETGTAKRVFLGHTHYRMSRKSSGCHVINPGSLGQPRDGMPSAYAVVDTDRDSVRFQDVDWDRQAFRASLEGDAGLSRYALEILDRQGALQ
ncbi:metallophosphatase family protein [Pseudodesulfovibrio sp.]|nr:metallophosphatase family protein [Pseudodesulfovibrio sp.]